MKKKDEIQQFPNIYRFITESKLIKKLSKLEFRLLDQSKHKKILTYFIAFISIVIIIFLFFGISIFSLKLYQEINLYSKITSQRQVIQENINFWQSFTQKYDGYKDAYFQIALLEYQLGNFEKAKEFNNKALLLDPGFNDAKELGVLLENR